MPFPIGVFPFRWRRREGHRATLNLNGGRIPGHRGTSTGLTRLGGGSASSGSPSLTRSRLSTFLPRMGNGVGIDRR
jgi:hypothetical protein